MTEEQNGVIRLAKRVQIIGGAIVLVSGITSVLGAFAWSLATKPILDRVDSGLREERHARVLADSLMIQQMRDMSRSQSLIAWAMQHPLWSDARQAALDSAQKIAAP